MSELPGELADRGIGWQVAGFTIVGCTGTVILWLWDGSEFWAYRILAIAVKDFYWAFILPLAWSFNGVRRMFEKASEIRAAVRERIREKGRQEGLQAGRQEARQEARQELRRHYSSRINEALERFAVTNDGVTTLPLTPEVLAYLLEEPGDE